jgi:translation initiation factor IF-2
MRIYELSKELEIPSKQLIEALQKEGVSVKSHMSAIGDKEVALLRKKFAQPATPQKIDKDSTKTSKDPMQKESVKRSPVTKPKARHIEESKSREQKNNFVQKKNVTPRAAQFEQAVKEAPTEIVLEPATVSEIADRMVKPVNDVILTLLKWRIIAPKNQQLSQETIAKLAEHYGIKAVPKESAKKEAAPLEKEGTGKLQERLPVVVVLGHVDHGKTTLLDYIRKTRVVSKEKGGITQHLGAYTAHTKHGDLVFLDTPGHEAFPKMRQRGIKVADIGILVVAADDGIMPQTVEAIQRLKDMNVPIVVAINKIDKVEPIRLETIKRQLAEQDLLPEEWGGQIVCVPISALEGKGVDQLLEMVSLQAELLELKASQEGFAHCYVLESKIEKGRGPVATLICQHGTLKVGDYFVSGKTSGRVSSIKDSNGNVLKEVLPSIPVSVAGFKDLPEAGDLFNVVDKADLRKALQQQADQVVSAARGSHEGNINIILKTDTNSSKEALLDAIYKMTKKSDVGVNIIHAAVGDINESDIELAYSTGSLIIGLHVKSESNALSLAQRRGVTVERHDIIYKLLEGLEERLESAKEIEMVRTKIGEAVVRAVFDIKGVGIVAGSYVQDGRFSRDGYVTVWRGKQKVGEGKITSLQRDKKSVKEVHAGYECGFVVDGITDWLVDDRVECYIEVPKK